MPRKRRTRQHVIADLSINHVERHVLLSGHTVERTWHDYGIDLLLQTYDADGQIESGRVLLQVKATDRLRRTADGQFVLVWVGRDDLDYWLSEPLPVILLVYDAQEDVAYWLHVQAYFAGRPESNGGKAVERVTCGYPSTTGWIRMPCERSANFGTPPGTG